MRDSELFGTETVETEREWSPSPKSPKRQNHTRQQAAVVGTFPISFVFDEFWCVFDVSFVLFVTLMVFNPKLQYDTWTKNGQTYGVVS